MPMLDHDNVLHEQALGRAIQFKRSVVSSDFPDQLEGIGTSTMGCNRQTRIADGPVQDTVQTISETLRDPTRQLCARSD
jgi:hypothetical protein